MLRKPQLTHAFDAAPMWRPEVEDADAILAMGDYDTQIALQTHKLHVIEIAIHLPLAFWLVSRFGITGSAMAWSARVIVDSLLLLVASKRILRVKPVEEPADLSDTLPAHASSR